MFFLKALCGTTGTNPRNCPELWGVFIHMSNWTGGECGAKNGSFCMSGKNEVSSPGNTYYALCAVPLGEPDYLIVNEYSCEEQISIVKN